MGNGRGDGDDAVAGFFVVDHEGSRHGFWRRKICLTHGLVAWLAEVFSGIIFGFCDRGDVGCSVDNVGEKRHEVKDSFWSFPDIGNSNFINMGKLSLGMVYGANLIADKKY